MKIGKKIAFGFSGVLALTAVVGMSGWLGLSGYASGVDKAQSMSKLVVDLHKLPLFIAEFERGENEAGHSEALRLSDGAIDLVGDMAKRDDGDPSLDTAKAELRNYREALERYGDFHAENQQRQLAMAETTKQIDDKINQI